ncbi:MAG: membrane protein [Acidimicrobiia bacterium]|nr:MAG: membrane protein [Acidimicrobiia bacterium]
MSTADWLAVAAIVVLFLTAILLAIAETAFLRMSRVKALALEEQGEKRAGRLAAMLEHPERTVNAVTLMALAAQLVTSYLLGILFGGSGPLWVAATLVLNVVVFFVFAEAAPKTWAVQHTDRAALRTTRFLWFLTEFPPVRWVVRALLGFVNWILPGKGLKKGPFVTEEEIRQMADVAAEEESIETEERELIHSIFEFGDTVVREVMLPRPDMVAVEADATVDEAISIAIDAGKSRLPAFDDTTDNIVGLVFLKDLVARSAAGEGDAPVRQSLRPAHFVPESKRVAELLREMQTEKFHMAIVVDEYGGTAGLVTMEDLLEEIVGEISDEYDVEEPTVERLADGTLRVPGRTPIDEVNELLGVELPQDEWDTVGGLVFSTLGHVPHDGECCALSGLDFCAERVQGRRIVSVLIRPAAPDGAAPAGAREEAARSGVEPAGA